MKLLLAAALVSLAAPQPQAPAGLGDVLHSEEWVLSGEWLRDDSQPGGTTFRVIHVPPIPEGVSRIWLRVESFNGVKWKWENTHPTTGLDMSQGAVRVEHELWMRDGPGAVVPIGGPHRDMWPYGMGSGTPLTPYDGLLDYAGASGWTETCPGTIPGAESGGSGTCGVPGGTYQAHTNFSLSWGSLTPGQQASFASGATLLYKPRLGWSSVAQPPVSWGDSHGWRNESDVYAQLWVEVSLEF